MQSRTNNQCASRCSSKRRRVLASTPLAPGCSPWATRSTHLRLAGAVEAGAQRGQRGQHRQVWVALHRVVGVHAGQRLAPGAVQPLQRAQVQDVKVVLKR